MSCPDAGEGSLSDFHTCLTKTFPFIRMLMTDAQDSAVTMFLSTRNGTEQDFTEIAQSLSDASVSLSNALIDAEVYPMQSELESCIQSLERVVAHLHAASFAFARILSFGGDIEDL